MLARRKFRWFLVGASLLLVLVLSAFLFVPSILSARRAYNETEAVKTLATVYRLYSSANDRSQGTPDPKIRDLDVEIFNSTHGRAGYRYIMLKQEIREEEDNPLAFAYPIEYGLWGSGMLSFCLDSLRQINGYIPTHWYL